MSYSTLPYQPYGSSDPKPTGNNLVVADFFIPGCCTFDDDCNPMCMTEDELKTLQIPPFAKSDFVMTFLNRDVTIHAFFNDDPIYGDELIGGQMTVQRINPVTQQINTFTINLFDETTEQGGRVTLSADKKYFIYTPPDEYIGNDRFTYTILNKTNRLSDTATVYIQVVKPGEGDISTKPTLTVLAGSTNCGNKVKGDVDQFIDIIIDYAGNPVEQITLASEPWLLGPFTESPHYKVDLSQIKSSGIYSVRLLNNNVQIDEKEFNVTVVTAKFQLTVDDFSIDPIDPFEPDPFRMMKSADTLDSSFSKSSSFSSGIGDFMPSRYINLNRIFVTVTNQSSPEAVSFSWRLLSYSGLLLGTSNLKDPQPWSISSTYKNSGFVVELTATSAGGCKDVLMKQYPEDRFIFEELRLIR